MSDPLLLIDGDVFLYNATLASEYETIDADEDTHYLASSFTEAHQGFINQINFVKDKLNSDTVRIAFTKTNTFRHDIYPAYKGHRVNKRKPLCFNRVREAIYEDYRCLDLPGLEADDILGIWATRDAHLDPIIVSADKDLKTIPGRLWRQGELTEISPGEADWWWLCQTLTGDVTDGYPGCPGQGPKKAARLLGDIEGWKANEHDLVAAWGMVVDTYEKAGLTANDALTQARLARILRVSDWDAKERKPILWTPPSPA